MAYTYDEFGNLVEFESDEERRKREEEERQQVVQTQTVETAADGSQTVTTEKEIPAGVQPSGAVTYPIAPQPEIAVRQLPAAQAMTPTQVQPQPVAPTDVFGRMVQAESGGKDFDAQGRPITSPKGAMFAAQVMPQTAQQPGFGVRPAQAQTAAEYNRVGQDYYQAMLQQFGGDERKAAAAYNAGPGRVQQAEQLAKQRGGSWTDYIPRETMNYLGQVFNKIIPSAQAGTLPQPQAGAGRGTMGMPQAFPEQGVAVATGRGVQGTTEIPQQVSQQQPPTAVAEQPTQPTNLQQSIDRYQTIQNNPMALLAMRDDQRVPESLRQRAGERARDLLNQEIQKRQAAEQAKQLIPAAATGDRQAANTVAKELQNQQGSWLKMILLSFVSPTLAAEEAIKLGIGNKEMAITTSSGKAALLTVDANGKPLSGMWGDGKTMSQEEYISAAAGVTAAKGTEVEAGTYADPTGKIPGNWVLERKPGGSVFRQVGTNNIATPEQANALQKSGVGGGLDYQRQKQIQEQNIKLAADWERLKARVAAAGPEAANKAIGDFNALNGTALTLQSLGGSAPQIDMATGRITQATPAPATAPAPAAAPATAAQVLQSVAPPAQAAPAQAAPAQAAPAQAAPTAVTSATSTIPRFREPGFETESPAQFKIRSEAAKTGVTTAAKEISGAAATEVAKSADTANMIRGIDKSIKIIDSGEHNIGSVASAIVGRGPVAQAIGAQFETKDARNTKTVMDLVNKLAADGLKALGSNPSTVDLEFWTKFKPDASSDPQFVKEWIQSRSEDLQRRVNYARQQLNMEPVFAKDEDRQAYEWTKKNANDPRAAQIRQKLGLQ